jgi:hypothetical protein
MRQARPQNRCDFIGSMLLTVVSVFVGLVIIEVALRTFWSEAPSSIRFLFITADTVRNVASGIPGYKPNASVHEVSIYNTSPGGFATEYDVRFHTNNQGNVQLADTFCNRTTIAVVGDSFAQGQGSVPWFYDLERTIPTSAQTPQLVNLGFMGTGVAIWKRALEHYRSCYKFSKIMLIFIGDDWYRPVWDFTPHDLECVSGNPCKDQTIFFFPLQLGKTAAELEQEVSRMSPQASQGWLGSMRSLTLAGLAMKSIADSKKFALSQEAFSDIAGMVAKQDLILLHIPMREETLTGPLSQTQRAVDWLAHGGYAVQECPIESSDFLPHDPHPNQKGYSKIRRCVETILLKLVAGENSQRTLPATVSPPVRER